MKKTRLPWNWRSRIEIKYEECKCDDDCHAITLSFKRGKTPRGYMKHIGELYADRSGLIVGASVNGRLRRKGLGKMMYTKMLEEVGCISTKLHDASPDAQRVWKSLTKNYKSEYDMWTDYLKVKK